MNEFLEQARDARENRVPDIEHMLGKGLVQPFNNTNSSPRKLMYNIHRDHILPLMNGEKAINETGYEIRYGDLSSSISETDRDYFVVAKITKFSFSPNHHYYLILKNNQTKTLDVQERISYHHITEKYGYLYNNEYMDTLQVGDYIPNHTILQKSLAFDEFNNRKDGVNLNIAYISMDQNMEDSMIFSDVAAAKLTSPLIKPVQITINENDIPLNIYGNESVYKCIPDIGEDIKDSILIALRKEKKEESLYTQSIEHLKKIMMSDKKFTLTGRVIDVNIYCNNPENLDTYYNAQFAMYYHENMRMCQEIVQTVTGLIAQGYKLTYELQALYANSKRILNKDPFFAKRQFSNIILEVVVLEEKKLEEGDKASNRYGGKGIISKIVPQHLMPKFGDEYVDVILNPYGVPNRENIGQCFEVEINFIGSEIIKEISTGKYTIDEAMDMVYKFLDIVSPVQSESLKQAISYYNNYEDQTEQKRFLLENMVRDKAIHVSIKPVSESFDIDRLNTLYQAFPWIQIPKLKVPMKNSRGEYRYVETRKGIIVGKQYMFRLKQYAEEKFSATSLSATNIRNENTKSKANRDYMELHRNTPIRFGNMEINDMNHLGAETVITTLMIHSVSPHARRLVEQMYTKNPFHVDIRLGEDSSNRSAEVVNTYLKTIGRRLVFKKKPKQIRTPIIQNAVTFGVEYTSPIYFFDENNNKKMRSPIKFYGARPEDIEKLW